MSEKENGVKGGEFLITDVQPADVCVPEDTSDEQVAIRQAVVDFTAKEVAPQAARLDEKDFDLLKSLIKQAGDLGFLGVDIPEANGGLGLDLVTAALVFEAIGGCGSGSFATAIGAHTGIGTWPIMYFGNDAQRQKYLPGIAAGDLIAAYALTESGSGSDALAARCKAVLSADGQHYVVNGEKVFITNAGIADVFTVFVKIDGDPKRSACLIVERGTPGFAIEREEHKMGIRGSSTCRLVFEDALVPAANLLGVIGKGHKVVLNTLNLGRFKLGAAAAGAIKTAVTETVRYAAERRQFGQPLTAFDNIKAEIAAMTVAGWLGESLVYRTAGLLSRNLEGVPPGDAATKAIEELTIECSIVKVALSEFLDQAADKAVQVHGGYGYIEEYPVCRGYRDARINRIFEGTSEINRMLAVGDLLKRGMTGRLELLAAVQNAYGEPDADAVAPGELRRQLQTLKRLTLATLGDAAMTLQMAIKDEQQVMMELADLLIAVYTLESGLLRLEKLKATGRPGADVAEAIVRIYAAEALDRAQAGATRVLAALFRDEQLSCKLRPIKTMLSGLLPDNVVELKRRVAAAVIEKNGYPF